jgi:hypothetical protein
MNNKLTKSILKYFIIFNLLIFLALVVLYYTSNGTTDAPFKYQIF